MSARRLKTSLLAIALLSASSLSAAAPSPPKTPLELKCDGVIYVNTKSGQSQYQVDISISLDLPNKLMEIDGRGFFTKNHLITNVTPQKYFIISASDKKYYERSGYRETGGDEYTWSSTLDRTNGYLVLIEGPIGGDRNAFNGTCTQAKTLF
jgi:hypothetical protein